MTMPDWINTPSTVAKGEDRDDPAEFLWNLMYSVKEPKNAATTVWQRQTSIHKGQWPWTVSRRSIWILVEPNAIGLRTLWMPQLQQWPRAILRGSIRILVEHNAISQSSLWTGLSQNCHHYHYHEMVPLHCCCLPGKLPSTCINTSTQRWSWQSGKALTIWTRSIVGPQLSRRCGYVCMCHFCVQLAV